jgi:hypothetical protein
LTIEISHSAKEFYKNLNFSNCEVCIYGKHIRAHMSLQLGSMHCNYKRYHSITPQSVANAKHIYICIEGTDRYSFKFHLTATAQKLLFFLRSYLQEQKRSTCSTGGGSISTNRALDETIP